MLCTVAHLSALRSVQMEPSCWSDAVSMPCYQTWVIFPVHRVTSQSRVYLFGPDVQRTSQGKYTPTELDPYLYSAYLFIWSCLTQFLLISGVFEKANINAVVSSNDRMREQLKLLDWDNTGGLDEVSSTLSVSRAVPEWVSVLELVLASPLHWSATRTPTMRMRTITTTTTTTTTKQTCLQLLRLSTTSTTKGGTGNMSSNWCTMASPICCLTGSAEGSNSVNQHVLVWKKSFSCNCFSFGFRISNIQ